MTICSYDNSGQIKFDVDVEMEQGYWNTSSSRLWTKIRDWMHDDLVEIYKDLRQNGLSYETLMKYFYDEQIAKIPQTYYNNDCDVKYIPYANEYIGKAHGDGYEHLKRWLKRRIIFCDTLFDYSPSYTNDVLTIRANTTETMTLEIETYSPVYQHLSWYNNQMDKKKIDGKTSVTFTGEAQAATDQEVLIYGGSNIKSIKGISTMNPNQMLIGSATRLIELDAKNCPLLTDINSNKANLSPHTYLNKVDLSGCSQLGGALRLNNSPLIRDVNMKGTVITSVQMPTSVRNLEVLRLPNTITSLTLQDASLLNTLEFDEGIALQSISLANCNNLTNTINFDLTQTPTVLLDNSYNAQELYMSATTNLTLKNMSELERVIYTPNSEYEAFDINNVINGGSYKVTTFNNPKMTTFMTTAPHRTSYQNGDYGDITPNTVFTANTLDLSDTQFTDIKFLCTTDLYNLKVPTSMKNFYCDSAMDIDTDVIKDASYEVIHEELIEPYTTNYESEVLLNDETPNIIPSSANGSLIFNMYSNNTTQPTSTSPYMWDLTGLKLEDFYTYGMNNWVKPSDDSYEYLLYPKICDGWRFGSNGAWGGTTYGGWRVLTPIKFPTDVKNVTITSDQTIIPIIRVSETTNSSEGKYSTTYNGIFVDQWGAEKTNGYREVAIGLYNINTHTYVKIETDTGLKYTIYLDKLENITPTNADEVIGYTIDSISAEKIYATVSSITMPQRLSGYSVRMVNADITPNNYATHLYPLLVDTTLPITGKLDYTKYNGTTLAWAYAYTTNDVAINPLGSQQQGNITNDYNKLYGTDFVDIVDVWAYKDADFSNKETNENITKAYIELTSANYESRIDEVLQWYPNCTDVYLFDDGSVTSLYRLSNFNGVGNNIHKTQIKNITFIEGYFDNLKGMPHAFKGCTSLVSVNNIPSGVNSIYHAFYGCTSLNCQLDFSNNTFINTTNNDMTYSFYNCSSLTTPPILPSNYIGSMADCFNGCSKLVEAPTIPDGVTNMNNTFKNCGNLTTSPTLPNGVTNMDGTFYGCKALVNPPIIPDSVTNLYGTFLGCESLTTCPTIPNGVTNMGSTFHSCPNITTPPTIPNNVTNISRTFQNCSSLTTAPTIPNSVTNMDNTFRGCTALLNGAILHENVTNIEYLYINCTSLKTAQIPVNATWGSYSPLQNCSSLEDITWVGMLNKDYSVPNLGWLGTNKYITQEDIKELVPEHLDDLYKDTIKLNCNDTKVTINDKEIIYVESARYVEYIQGDGTNYIDIDIYANPQWKYELTRSGTDTAYGVVFDSGDYTRFRISSAYQSTLMYNTKEFTYDHNLNTDTSVYTVTIDKNKCYENGELKATITETNDTTQFTKGVRLFKTFQSRTDIYRVSVGKLYSFKMWDENGTLQFDGRPCLVNEKYPCIYDEVSKKFFFPKS